MSNLRPLLFLTILICLIVITNVRPQSVSVDHVEGLHATDTLWADSIIVFHIRMTAGEDNYPGITNGFRVYSPDGALWSSTTADTTGSLTGDDFDLVWLMNYFSATGLLADTVGFAGAVASNPTGMPIGFDDITHTISIGPIDGTYHGKTICLDSCWFPWVGYWLWSVASDSTIVPSWDGPHCFSIIDPLSDSDEDGVVNMLDNCISTPNPNQLDTDHDGPGDLCDNCPDVENPNQIDLDGDSLGNVCDNCEQTYNPEQEDVDGDNIGDACDNCPNDPNSAQDESDRDFIGDVCDNCPDHKNADQVDVDEDGYGDVCDNCPDTSNIDQSDVDNDGIGDLCDECTDSDGDGYGNPGHPASTCEIDNCPGIFNPGQEDADGDGVGDICSCCALRGDMDHDGEPVNISDLIYMVTYMFNQGPPPPCIEESDVDGRYDGLNISDLVFIVNYMFSQGPVPPDCIPSP